MAKKKYIETPEDMLELFEEYKTQTKSKPRHENFFYAKEGKEVAISRETPLTIEGFRNFSRKKHKSVEHYFANTDNAYDDYRTVCSYIKDEIRQDQIEGGMVGIYNPSITQRLNNLVDKQDLTSKGQQIKDHEIKVNIVKDGDTSD